MTIAISTVTTVITVIAFITVRGVLMIVVTISCY